VQRSGRLLGRRTPQLALLAVVLMPLAVGDQPGMSPLPRSPARDFSGRPSYEVLDVRAGNVIVARLAGEQRVLRLIGTYVPAAGSAADPARPFLMRMLKGESVYIEYDEDYPLRDRQDRHWAYVYRAPDGLLVNLELIRQGYARLSARVPFEHQGLLRAYEKHARRCEKGVWAPKPAADVVEPKVATSQPTGEAVGPEVAKQGAAEVVKVYITPHGRKYHSASCHYAKSEGATAITLDEARRRGYTPCSRCGPPE